MIALIVAYDRNRAIGRGNALPWHLPDDLKRFKALTLGGTVLMGRRTAESIGRALPGRRNLVLTRGPTAPFAGQEVVASLDAAIAACRDATLWVIGGGEVYALALPLASRVHATEVDVAVDGADAFFPALPDGEWRRGDEESHPADAKHAVGFRFVALQRVASQRAE
jgi:dihydrofolate reductase